MRPQRLVLGPVFILLVTLGMEGSSEMPRFAEDPQFLQVVRHLSGSEENQKWKSSQRSKWTNKWQLNFTVGKCGIPIGKSTYTGPV